MHLLNFIIDFIFTMVIFIMLITILSIKPKAIITIKAKQNLKEKNF